MQATLYEATETHIETRLFCLWSSSCNRAGHEAGILAQHAHDRRAELATARVEPSPKDLRGEVLALRCKEKERAALVIFGRVGPPLLAEQRLLRDAAFQMRRRDAGYAHQALPAASRREGTRERSRTMGARARASPSSGRLSASATRTKIQCERLLRSPDTPARKAPRPLPPATVR